MPVYRCGICNVFSSSLEQHARHLNGARHKRNEASALAGTVRAASNGAGKGAKRARRDAAAVAACLETLDGAAPAAGLPPLREWLLRRDAVRSAPRIPRRFGGDTRLYADLFRHAMAAEAFEIIDRSLGAGEVADHEVLRVNRQQRLVVILHREHIYPDAFVRFLCGESAVALMLDESKPGERAFRCREGTEDAFFEEVRRRRTVRVEYLESVVSLIRADDALRRAFLRDPPPVALAFCRDGGQAAPEKHDDSDPWRAATDASGRQYFYHSLTRETRWTRPEKTEKTADWISDAVLSAVDDTGTAAPPKQALDTTISLIHGPPGTGKTKELASLLLASKGRVLACAPSNRAVLELLDRFRALGRRRAVLVGVGQVETHVTYESCRSPGSRDAARFSEILFCTLATAGRPDLRAIIGARELLVVDEAGQALEPDVLSAAEAAQARRCVLCGDPMQLPPTVLSAAGVEAGLASSPMERLLEVRDTSVALRFLDEQRRMHPAISAFPNATYYGGRVRDASALVARPRPDWLPYSITKDASPLRSRTVVDVAHGVARHDGPSLRNDAEADAVDAILSTLFQRLLARASVDVAVISFYKAQIQSLERALAPIKQRLGAGAGQSLRIGTVDAFQGSEADVVIISAVRAGTSDVGFVADERRLNVALTRARHVSFFVCHAETLRAATHRSTAGALVATEHVRALMADADARGDVVDSALLL